MNTHSEQISLADHIAEIVRRAFEAELSALSSGSDASGNFVRAAHRPERAARAAAESHTETAAPAAAPKVTEANAAAAPSSVVAGASAQKSSGNDIIERVRADLSAAYEGRPVTADRLAFRLKADRDLVDAALTYLVSRKQARSMGARGKIGYVPFRTV